MDLRESVASIQAAQDVVGHAFYERFFERCPEARPLFANVNMRQQGVLLTVHLAMVEAFSNGQEGAAAHYLQILGTRHQDKGVPRALYPKFRDVLLETLADFHGDDWTPPLEAAWHKALEAATERMRLGYDQRFAM